jgi:hypothetical protein
MRASDQANSPPFLLGVNLPWLHYGIDFGRNAWRPQGGISQPDSRARIEAVFARLAQSSVRHVRWFLLCDGRAGIRYDNGGRPVGLDDCAIEDIDAALEAAESYGMTLMFVLLDFLICDRARVIRGVQLGGRSGLLEVGDDRDAFLDLVLQPLLERYGHAPQIFAWDIINEPEWIRTVSQEEVHDFLQRCITLVHSSTQHQATVGSAGARWRDRYRGLDLDFYQVHWYDKLLGQPTLDTPVAEMSFDRPVLLGEFPTRGSRQTPREIVATARRAGYAGAFAWSLSAGDECSDGSECLHSISSSAFTPLRMP